MSMICVTPGSTTLLGPMHLKAQFNRAGWPETRTANCLVRLMVSTCAWAVTSDLPDCSSLAITFQPVAAEASDPDLRDHITIDKDLETNEYPVQSNSSDSYGRHGRGSHDAAARGRRQDGRPGRVLDGQMH